MPPHVKPKSKITASRKLSLKILLLSKAMEELEKETMDRDEEKVRYLGEKMAPLQMSGLSMDELQSLCKQLHHKIDVVDEERYDCENVQTGKDSYGHIVPFTEHNPYGHGDSFYAWTFSYRECQTGPEFRTNTCSVAHCDMAAP